jgi:hypothetical protein
MPTLPVPGDTVRLDILKYIQTIYQHATAANPATVPKKYYGIDFSVVEIGPLGGEDSRKRSAVGIVAGKERKSALYPVWDAMFSVAIEFSFTINRDDDDKPGVIAEQLLGIVQQVLYDDDALGGKVLKFDEKGSELDLLTYQDRSLRGVLHIDVHYRHNYSNVYSTNPAFG